MFLINYRGGDTKFGPPLSLAKDIMIKHKADYDVNYLP
jgi:hypothetical protein